MNIALFASGNGSNVLAILKTLQDHPQVNIVTLVCDNPEAGVLNKVAPYDLDILVAHPKEFKDRMEWEQVMIDHLKSHQVALICLAGFMRILGEKILSEYAGKIINIHPSLLPDFPGRHGIQDAFEAGVSETGVTIHFVDEGIDTGDIIYQESLEIEEDWTLEILESNIHKIEHRIYPMIVQAFAEGKYEEDFNE